MFEENLKGIVAALEDRTYDAFLLTSPENRFYATGFHSSDGIVLISKNRALYATDFRYFEDACDRVKGFEMVMTSRGNPYTKIIEDFCKTEGITQLGFEDGAMSVAAYGAMRQRLSVKLAAESGLLSALRLVKKPFEVERIVAAQRIAEKAFEKLLPSIKPGVAEREIAAELDYQIRLCGAQGNSFDTIAVSGANGSHCHGVPGDRRLQDGDFLTLDFGALKDGYCSDMTRTVAIGHVTEEMRTVYNTVLKAQLESIAAAKAGIIGAELHGIADKIISDAGYGEYFGHGLGHSVGIEVHDGPGASPSNPNPIPAGAVVTIEPGIYIPGKFGVRIEDFLLFEEGGNRNLTETPKELLIL